MSEPPIGFIGLGNMGRPMAENLAGAGQPLVVYDLAVAAQRGPDEATVAESVAEVAETAATVFLSLPDGGAVRTVADEMAAAPRRIVELVVDTSTIGLAAARFVHARLLDEGIEYLDAPVSGGVAGARSATIAMMCAGAAATVERLRPTLAPMAANVIHVGDVAGQAQAMKLLNNFLSATALTATSEAIAFGTGQGLALSTMLEVLNVSSGRNSATADKFPNQVVTGTYDAGFTARLMLKDLLLFEETARESGAAHSVNQSVVALYRALDSARPNADCTHIYPFVAEAPPAGQG